MKPVRYTLSFPERRHHLLTVRAVVPAAPGRPLDLMLPAWTPGSYKIRDYSRHLQRLQASEEDGRPLAVVKTSKSRWRVAPPTGSEVRLEYRVYGREASVRTNFVDDGFALVNGAATFLTPVGATSFEVTVEVPEEWDGVWSPLAAIGEDDTRFLAPDLDTLVDSPFYAGSPSVYPFEVAGTPHWLVDEGEGETWPGERAAAHAARIAAELASFWGELPYPRYVLLNLIGEARGGLEHRDGTVLMTPRWKARRREGWLEWLGLVCHEMFHAWNGKRLRPVELGPFDYEREVTTATLWWVEGVTSYYDDLLVRRAGLSTDEEHLRLLSKQIESLETTPGRRLQDLELASIDAWIKHYQPDESTANTAISYYVKGAVVAFLLDMEIRRSSEGRRSLDHVLREAYRRHAGERGYTGAEMEALASEIAGADLGAFFAAAVRSTADLHYAPALAWLGLRFAAPKPKEVPWGVRPAAPDEPPGWLGAGLEVRDGRLVVTEVREGTAAWEAGLTVEDEILAIDGFRVPPRGLDERLAAYRPGDRVTLTLVRRQRLRELSATLGSGPESRWSLEPDPAASTEQRERREEWWAPSRAW